MKSRLIIFFGIYFLAISTHCYACICGILRLKDLQLQEIETSDCIFIAEITEISSDKRFFSATVIESLDGGDLIGNTYTGKNWKSCSPFVDTLGTWLLYGINEDDFLRLNSCGISRSFVDPLVYPSVSLFVPTEKDLNKKDIESELKKRRAKNLSIAKKQLYTEIYNLRKRRDNF